MPQRLNMKQSQLYDTRAKPLEPQHLLCRAKSPAGVHERDALRDACIASIASIAGHASSPGVATGVGARGMP
jgi:hypothetical protein